METFSLQEQEPSLHPMPLNQSHYSQSITVDDEDSAVTKAEKLARHGVLDGVEAPPSKRMKLDHETHSNAESDCLRPSTRKKGVAPIKAEFLIHLPINPENTDKIARGAEDANRREVAKKAKSKGQNYNRSFGSSRDEIGLCQSRVRNPEFSPSECQFGDKCRFEHNLRKYLKEWKREDLTTFGGICPVWKAKGRCDVGWKCRFVGSHMQEHEREDGVKELVLMEDENHTLLNHTMAETDILNTISTQAKVDLMKRKTATPKADEYSKWLENNTKEAGEQRSRGPSLDQPAHFEAVVIDDELATELKDNRARYIESPFRASEKRRIYFGPETPVLAPLTTQGNLPFRRLCVDLGAQITYSEMAMSLPLIQGQKSEWALLRAHESEMVSPKHQPGNQIITEYDNAKDFRFGAQIAANKPWQAFKAAEIITKLCPQLRVLDLNCGCPIDLVYRTGAGSALLDNPSKLDKMVRGMNAISGEIPITVKIRMGTKDNKPTAHKLVNRLVYGSHDTSELSGGPSGVAAITLHGRSRQQRYTKNADWQYIAECAALIQRYNEEKDSVSDTAREADSHMQASSGKVFFLGNGDCYSHIDYHSQLENARVDSVMIARGALIKPWIFEEIQQGQYLDKSASERLAIIEKYVRYGLETWGSDEIGIGTTRRFLLEWLSFAYRYVPVGILEHLPPSLQDRPPAWKGRNELETLLGSDNYKDWIKISEMFLGPPHKNFKFEPKHKSNSYEIEAEG